MNQPPKTETKPSMPAQPTTKAIPALTDRALLEDLARTVKEGFARNEANHELALVELGVLQKRIVVIERWRDENDIRLARNSGRAASLTEDNTKQDVAIAQIANEVKGLKDSQLVQLNILMKLDAVAANPLVRRVAYAIGGAVLTYLAARGVAVK